MIAEKILEKFGGSTPVFAKEILALFPEYSKTYVYRILKKEIEAGTIVRDCAGVYYVPKQTEYGPEVLIPDQIVEKKYLFYGEEPSGIYCGLALLNQFGVTTQMTCQPEIITNQETNRNRKIEINGRVFYLKKSRCPITRANHAAYTLVQLFYDLDEQDSLDEISQKLIRVYIRENGVTKEQVMNVGVAFPQKALKRMIAAGVFNEFA